MDASSASATVWAMLVEASRATWPAADAACVMSGQEAEQSCRACWSAATAAEDAALATTGQTCKASCCAWTAAFIEACCPPSKACFPIACEASTTQPAVDSSMSGRLPKGLAPQAKDHPPSAATSTTESLLRRLRLSGVAPFAGRLELRVLLSASSGTPESVLRRLRLNGVAPSAGRRELRVLASASSLQKETCDLAEHGLPSSLFVGLPS